MRSTVRQMFKQNYAISTKRLEPMTFSPQPSDNLR